jgi:hypothetical protein
MLPPDGRGAAGAEVVLARCCSLFASTAPSSGSVLVCQPLVEEHALTPRPSSGDLIKAAAIVLANATPDYRPVSDWLVSTTP